ncbi:hypothetical protein SAMN05216215_103253 [Saccharopolyspora shandongensis]|uniref:Uncharacterized protein n=1 Tax=Saccharopolyspora shandongensis TaxID=418495 RepID=A0A1H3LUW0_9PSEU|nr:hypothetical protein [Saccharopolyspora shandongensis]SDY67798.1 hypothetical protein SAMN05216215_103253 [Saccharopolyspora shandongensis]
MALLHYSGMSIDSFVEMEDEVPMRYEIDRHNDLVVLYCGRNSEYVLSIGRESLAALISLGTKAIAELTAA